MNLQIKMRRLNELLLQAAEVAEEVNVALNDCAPSATATGLVVHGKRTAFWRQSMTDWPRLVAARIPRVSYAFESEKFRDLYRAGEPRLVYVGACPGLRRIAMQLHVPVFKIGSCAEWGLANRILQLRETAYASAWFDTDRYVVDDDFADWFPLAIKTRLVPCAQSPVTIVGTAFRVAVPESMSGEAFEEKVRAVMAPAQLFKWLETPDALRHCESFGVDAAIGRRSTPYYRAALRLSPASEVYAFRAQSDFDRLFCALESIVLDAVVGDDPS
jgi:hypothetical protein